jgi:undecaprenyl-diphosphatase
MTTIEALILGIVQGVTEFLPVSSSGHLRLGELFFGYESADAQLWFNVILHSGSLCAIILGLYKPLIKHIRERSPLIRDVIIATLPLFPLVFLMKPIKVVLGTDNFLGIFYILTAILLFLGERYGQEGLGPLTRPAKTWKSALAIGCFQALSVLPGISRSGTTISVARVLGRSREDAVNFSFFLAIPATFGALAYEGLKALKGGEGASTVHVPLSSYFLGFLAAFVVGTFCFKLIRYLAKTASFNGFALYCFFLGIGILCFVK